MATAEAVGGVVIDIRAPVTGLQRDLAEMRKLLDQFAKQSEQTRQTTERQNRQMADSFKEVNKSLGGLESAFRQIRGVLALVGIDLGIRALKQFVVGNLEAAGSLGELAEQLGVGAENLQVYQYAATQVNLSSEEMNAAIARLSRTIGAAAEGNKEAIDAFQKLGLGVLDSAGNLRSTDDILHAVMLRMRELATPAEQARVAFELFGRSGQRLLPFLREGAEGMARLKREMQERGILLSSEQIAQADAASDALARMNVAVQRLSQALTIKISPWIIDFLDALAKAFIPTQAEQIEQLTGRIQKLQEILSQGGILNFLIYGPKIRYQGQLKELQEDLNNIQEMQRRTGVGQTFFPPAAPEKGVNPPSKEQSDLNKSAQVAIERARAQVEAQQRLVDAYKQGPDAVLAAQRAIDALTKTQSTNEKFTKDQRDAIEALNEQLVVLQQNAAFEKMVAGIREEGQEQELLAAARGRDTAELRTQIALLKIRAQFGSEAAKAAEADVRATEVKRDKVAVSTTRADLLDESRTLQEIINNRGIETTEIRIQTELMKLRRRYDDETVKSLEDQVRLVQQQREQVQDMAAMQRTQADLLRVESEARLRGASPRERAIETAVLEKEIELRARGKDLTDAQAVAEINATRQLAERRFELDQLQQTYDVLAQIGEQAFDRIGSALTEMFVQGEGGAFSWRNVMLGVLSEVYQAMIRLAVINPLLNAIGLGGKGGLPTIVNVLGAIGLSSLGGMGRGAGPVVAPNEAFLNAPHYAGGTDYARSGMALVGEEGPEFIRMRGGEQVIPAPMTARMMQPSYNQGGAAGSWGNQTVFNVDMRGASQEAVSRLEALVQSVDGRLNRVTHEMPNIALAAVVDARRRQPKLFTQRSK